MSLKQQALDGFCEMLGQFISAALVVWPEDEALKEFQTGYQIVMNPALGSLGNTGKQKLIQEYYDSLSPYFSRCSAKDVTLFTEERIEILEQCNLREKWLDNTISEKTRDTIWSYILELNRLCQMYIGLFSRVPDSALGKIQNTANMLAAKMAQGQMNLGDIDLAGIGQDVAGSMSEEEMQELMNGILSDPSALMNLAATMAPAGGGGIDPSMIAQVMGGAAQGGSTQDFSAQIMSMLMQQSMQN